MSLRPVGLNVLIKPFGGTFTYGALHLPDTARAKASDGVALRVGERCRQVAVGDHVIFSRRQAHDVEHNGEALVIIDERGCLVVLEEEEPTNAEHTVHARDEGDVQEPGPAYAKYSKHNLTP